MRTVMVMYSTHLYLAVNYSVFMYEVLSNPEEAYTMARATGEDVIAELDSVVEESYKDSMLILQLMREDLMLGNP